MVCGELYVMTLLIRFLLSHKTFFIPLCLIYDKLVVATNNKLTPQCIKNINERFKKLLST